MAHTFERDSAIERTGAGLLKATVSPDWMGYKAAHGGYLAALCLAAMQSELDEPSRVPRSLTVHFLRGPEAAEVQLEVETLRVGGRLTNMSARMLQDGRPVTAALAAFGTPFGDADFQDIEAPEAPAPESCPRQRCSVPIDHRFELRQALGNKPFSGADRARYGGWGRLAPPRPLDAVAVTMLCDAWWPAVFTRTTGPRRAGAVPTLDLTIHFRASLPHVGMPEDAHCLMDIESSTCREGYIEERCEVWAPDGTLLAQTVQHAARRLPEGAQEGP